MTIIKDSEERLAELLATFTPEEMEQYKIALGLFDQITTEMAFEEMQKLGISDFHMTGVDLTEKGAFAKLLTHLESIKKQVEVKENTEEFNESNHYGLKIRTVEIKDRAEALPFTKRTESGLPEGFGKMVPKEERKNMKLIKHPLNVTKENNNG